MAVRQDSSPTLPTGPDRGRLTNRAASPPPSGRTMLTHAALIVALIAVTAIVLRLL
ncbi:MAG: hypothetical protein M3Y87_04130 [Myxococcota bacterium]|nr:hypothetical protein [Myxococcota bacterium]